MSEKNIFIHIPKTGGTTLNTAIHNVYWQTALDFNYRHIQGDTKYSTCGDIFESLNLEKYRQYTIFMMLREPVDRVVSEYYFLRERKEFVKFLKPEPVDFKSYYTNRQTHNYMVGFLVGKRIYDTKPTTEDDLNKVIEAIEKLPIHVGIFEYFNPSMGYFQDVTGIKWHKRLEAKRMTLNRPKKEEISNEVRQIILENNYLDKKLYDYCLAKFEKEILPKHKNFSIDFVVSKYNHVAPYAAKSCLFEFCMDNKNYIKQNFEFFKGLTFYLLKDLKVSNGEVFCRTWNHAFHQAVSETHGGTPFFEIIDKAYKSSEEPLEVTINMAQALDKFFNEEGKKADKYYKSITFNKDKIVLYKSKEDKKGFLSKLFGK
jgi:hypothetical protein